MLPQYSIGLTSTPGFMSEAKKILKKKNVLFSESITFHAIEKNYNVKKDFDYLFILLLLSQFSVDLFWLLRTPVDFQPMDKTVTGTRDMAPTVSAAARGEAGTP